LVEAAHQQWQALEAAQSEACDHMLANTLALVAAQKKAFEDAERAIVESQQRITLGNQITYDLSTQAGLDHFRELNPSAFVDPSLTTEYFRNHTLADAIKAHLIDLYAGFRGRAFAGGTDFAPGGMALVGERGPELVNLPRGSQVIPNHMLGGVGGVTVHVGDVHVAGNVIGSQAQLATLIGDAVSARLLAMGVTRFAGRGVS
jgi:hypothetical protein